MTRDEAEQQYRETCDRMGTDADPVGVLAWRGGSWSRVPTPEEREALERYLEETFG